MSPVTATPADTARGRPRDEACTVGILSAALDLVAEVGIAGLSMEAVAARAGVGKATIYRRWPSKEALMLDAWASCVRPVAEPDAGSLRADLEAIFADFTRNDDGRDLSRIYPQMIAAAKVNPDVADAYRAFVAERRRPLAAVLERAQQRGEIDARFDIDVVEDLLVAPILLRWLVTDGPIDRTVTDGLIDAVVQGVAPR